MAILTRAELAHYPGMTATEQALAEHRERGGPTVARAKSISKGSERGAVPLPLVLDLRPFPGRDRADRIKAWLVAHTPRAATWSDETLRELSSRIAATSRLIE